MKITDEFVSASAAGSSLLGKNFQFVQFSSFWSLLIIVFTEIGFKFFVVIIFKFIFQDFLYVLKNYSFTDMSMNKFMPFLHFIQGLEFYESNKMLGFLKTKGSLLPKTKKKIKH